MHRMNWDHMEGAWDQYKGQVKQKWGKLTDDDLMYIAGSRDRLVGVLQQRYGLARERIEEQVEEFAGHDETAPASDGWVGKAKHTFATATEKTKNFFQNGKLGELVGEAENYLRRHPVPGTLVGVGVGFLLGALLSRGRPKVVAEPLES